MDDADSFEEKIRAIAREVGKSVEQAAEQIDLDDIADRIGMSSERVREFADLAGQWLSSQFGDFEPPVRRPDPFTADEAAVPVDAHPVARSHGAESTPRRPGPHPLDVPTEEQGLALSALDSGRWRVEPGTNDLISHGEGPDPADAIGLVGELRARDWIAATGEVTLVGRDALKRWVDRAG